MNSPRHHSSQACAFALLALFSLFTISTVRVADITVDAACTLADAIVAANTDLPQAGCPAGDGADVIFLTDNVVLSAELPYVESEMTVEGNGYAISGDLSYRIFSVGETALTLNRVTLKDGRSVSGSAISAISGATITINFGRIEGNVVFGSILDFGGAIYCWPCDLSIKNSVLRNNTASGDGGAIYFSACCGQTLNIFNSVFAKNNAGGHGGGVYIGVLHRAQTATIAKSAFADNWASGDGGGIYRKGHQEEWSGKLVIENSTFHHNSAHYGGGLVLGVHTFNTLRNVTLADNDANYGSSIFAVGLGITNLYSTVIARDERNEMCYGYPSVIADSIIEDGSCEPPLEGDALLGDLVEPEDGTPAYYPLLPGSPAIDAVHCDESIPADQIGTPRPQGARCDLGAIEYVLESAR